MGGEGALLKREIRSKAINEVMGEADISMGIVEKVVTIQ